EVVDLAAAITGERAEEGADERGERGGRKTDEQRGLRTLDRLLEHIPAPLVGAERQRGRPGLRTGSRPGEALRYIGEVGRERIGDAVVGDGLCALRHLRKLRRLRLGTEESGRRKAHARLVSPVAHD